MPRCRRRRVAHAALAIGKQTIPSSARSSVNLAAVFTDVFILCGSHQASHTTPDLGHAAILNMNVRIPTATLNNRKAEFEADVSLDPRMGLRQAHHAGRAPAQEPATP